MATPTSSPQHLLHPQLGDLCVISKPDLHELIQDIEDLWDSSSNDGCEAPFFVGDQTHLDSLKSRLARLKSLNTLDKALRLVNGDPESRSEPILLVVPPQIPEAEVPALMDKVIAQAAIEHAAAGEEAHLDVLQRQLGQHGIAMATGIENVQCQPWDADLDAIGDEVDPATPQITQESIRER
ncbi:MAG: hypothetical protein Q7V53_03055 [Caldisericota bacterium]|nr:hypothetical protein [Caldisericota bacterium]